MLNIRHTFIALAVSSAIALPALQATAAPAKKAAKAATVTQVNVCPMTGEKVVGKGSGSAKVGNYNVHFCCGGCPEAFAKLSPAEKQAKIKAALKVQNSGKKA